MNQRRTKIILLTAFHGTSAERLVKGASDCRILVLPSDKVRDSEMLEEILSAERFDYVISIGQRPNIKNKVHIETTARDEECSLVTDFDCYSLLKLFEEKGIHAKISHSAGTSFCNQLYLRGLRHIFQENLDTKMVFVHIPFLKNITDFEGFQKQFLNVIASCIQ